MKKITLLFAFLLLSFSAFSQIINYFDRNNLPTTIKENVSFVEVISKVNDTLWKRETLSRTGKLLSYTHYKSADKKNQVGQSVHYHFNGKIATLNFYNNNGLLNGKTQRWFYDGKKDRQGYYVNNKKHGVWKFYHTNGKLASRLIYKNDLLMNSFFFDENGNIQKNTDVKKGLPLTTHPYERIEKPIFKGGHQRYIEKIQDIISNSDFDIQGKIKLSYTIDVDGKIKAVTIDEKIPKKLFDDINKFLKNMNGWTAGVSLNRKVPFRFSHILNFQ